MKTFTVAAIFALTAVTATGTEPAAKPSRLKVQCSVSLTKGQGNSGVFTVAHLLSDAETGREWLVVDAVAGAQCQVIELSPPGSKQARAGNPVDRLEKLLKVGPTTGGSDEHDKAWREKIDRSYRERIGNDVRGGNSPSVSIKCEPEP